jgi:hypothetical protein
MLTHSFFSGLRIARVKCRHNSLVVGNGLTTNLIFFL